LDFDNKVRTLPPLGFPGSKSYHPLTSPFMVATFDVLERMTRNVDWSPDPIEQQSIHASPQAMSLRVKGFAGYLGADLVGITKLNPAYVYSHIGRSPGEWGSPISLDHPYAIAICVEMDHGMIRHAPHHATTTETAQKYFKTAHVATVVARYINLLGYQARAHVDGNYRVLCVPIAVDAGLGELGRLGLLVTPEFGPRVRISVVTTDLPLQSDHPIQFGVQDFCDFCKKCAENCPSGAIQSGPKSQHNGVEKWQSVQESCYKYWRIQGSDCSLCIHVCPYAHPRSPMHNMVRWAIRRNALARRIALVADDLFYGRHPKDAYPLPDWHDQRIL
jgi:ferredoxin